MTSAINQPEETATIGPKTTPKPGTWKQVENLHRWELRSSDRVLATAWCEGRYWHWSVPGSQRKLHQRGINKNFRVALKQAKCAAGVEVPA